MYVKQSLVLDGGKGELVKASGRVKKTIGVPEAKTMAALKSHSEAERRRRDRINAHLETLRGLVPSNTKSLVLDGGKGELVKASGRVKKTIGVPEAKTMAALKSHSEAERRRRDRINAHLETLRGLVPSNTKIDKATLLAEVISQVKQLRKTATQATEGLNIPMDTDEVKVEKLEKDASNRSFLVKASLSCEYSPDLLSDVRQAIKILPIKLLKSEISILGGRVKSVFLLTANEEGESKELLLSSIHAAFCYILDKVSASAEFAHPLVYPQKRQRVSHFDSSCSSS